MYCPSCGTKTSVSQKFCRSCGMSLAMISQMLTGHQSPPEPKEAGINCAGLIEGPIQKFRKGQRRRKLVILAPLIVLLAITSLGFKMAETSLPIALLIGIILGRYASLVKLPFRRLGNQATAPLPAESTMNLMPTSSYESMPSITEPTTRTLNRR